MTSTGSVAERIEQPSDIDIKNTLATAATSGEEQESLEPITEVDRLSAEIAMKEAEIEFLETQAEILQKKQELKKMKRQLSELLGRSQLGSDLKDYPGGRGLNVYEKDRLGESGSHLLDPNEQQARNYVEQNP